MVIGATPLAQAKKLQFASTRPSVVAMEERHKCPGASPQPLYDTTRGGGGAAPRQKRGGGGDDHDDGPPRKRRVVGADAPPSEGARARAAGHEADATTRPAESQGPGGATQATAEEQHRRIERGPQDLENPKASAHAMQTQLEQINELVDKAVEEKVRAMQRHVDNDVRAMDERLKETEANVAALRAEQSDRLTDQAIRQYVDSQVRAGDDQLRGFIKNLAHATDERFNKTEANLAALPAEQNNQSTDQAIRRYVDSRVRAGDDRLGEFHNNHVIATDKRLQETEANVAALQRLDSQVRAGLDQLGRFVHYHVNAMAARAAQTEANVAALQGAQSNRLLEQYDQARP